jgi:hypothetical protein
MLLRFLHTDSVILGQCLFYIHLRKLYMTSGPLALRIGAWF